MLGWEIVGSKVAAEAIYTCRELEFCQYNLRDALSRMALSDGTDTFLAEEVANEQRHVTEQERQYAQDLAAVKVAFPQMVCCDQFESGRCAHGKQCVCGWTQAPWPWIVHRHGGRFCDCHMESRAAWMKPARIRYWAYLNPAPGIDLGHHLFPNSGPQRGPGSSG